MAAATKPGPVHYTLVIFVVATIVLGITNYYAFKSESEGKAEKDKVMDENKTLNQQIRNLEDDLTSLKTKIGIKLDKTDDRTNPQNQATVVYALNNEMTTYGKDLVGKDVQETIRKLRDGLDQVSADRDSKTAKIRELENQVLALKAQYQAQVDDYGGKWKESVREKQEAAGVALERDNAKLAEVQRLEKRVRDSDTQLQEEQDSREKERNKSENAIAGLEMRIDTLRERLDEMEKLSFESADGVITGVQHSNGTVLINLGDEDFLKPRMTFSIYAKDSLGIGRGTEDIKGKIEVTRTLGAHLSEAKVTDEDLYRPIVTGDSIYTPIWSPGLIEKVSIIGDIDLDNDGRSDREQFHQMLAVAGCMLDNEVNDDGDRVPEDGAITVQTRFFVKGNIPDPLKAVTAADKVKSDKVNALLTKMEKEARTNGVRTIKLNDFLSYIGFHSKRRTFLPGQDRPFDLKAGTKGVIPTESKDKTSNGNVSGAYTRGRWTKQETSSGDVSKAFGGK